MELEAVDEIFFNTFRILFLLLASLISVGKSAEMQFFIPLSCFQEFLFIVLAVLL